jgi:hypothetical protein
MTDPGVLDLGGAAGGGPTRPLSLHPGLPGQHLVRRASWASNFSDRTIIAETGSTVRLRITNRLAAVHELRVEGDLLVHPPSAGTFLLHVDLLHLPTNKSLATRTIPVIAR